MKCISCVQRHLLPTLATAALAVTLSAPAAAVEGGISYYVPGKMATLIDRLPIQAGWVIKPQLMQYSGSLSTSTEVPIARLVSLGLDVEIDAFAPGATYTFEEKVLGGGLYTIGAFTSLVDVTVTGTIEAAELGSLTRRESVSGLGDTTLIPIALAWVDECWQYNFALPIYAPTGDYEAGRLANEGLNYWGVNPTVGVAYSNQGSGFNASMYLGALFNGENSDTDYDSGNLVHLDVSVQQMIKAGSGFITLGLNGYWAEQVSADNAPGPLIGDFEMRSAGIGPVLGYLLPMGKDNIVVEFSWLPQTETENTPEGDYYWLKFVYQFQ